MDAWIEHARSEDVSTWPTKADLRTQLHVTDRTIERWVKQGKLAAVQRRITGAKSFPVYNPDDVRRLLQDVVSVVPHTQAMPTPRDGRTAEATDNADMPDMALQLRTATGLTLPDIKRLFVSLLSLSDVSPTQKTYLSLTEAEQVSGLSDTTLKDLAHAGRLPFIRRGPRGHWKFRRTDIEAITNADIMAVWTADGVRMTT